MTRSALAFASIFVLAACSAGPGGTLADRRVLRPVAEPSAVISAELAFARAARETGTWTAFRKYATRDALWPAPRWQNVHDGLKGQADPAQPIVWGPDLVWSSCDGSFALSTGPATYPGGRKSRFATIWQRQNDGEYRWVLDQGFDLEAGYSAPEMISAKIADCPAARDPLRIKRVREARRGETWHSGRSDDGSLVWKTDLKPDCSRVFTVSALQAGTVREVFERVSAPPSVPPGTPPASC